MFLVSLNSKNDIFAELKLKKIKLENLNLNKNWSSLQSWKALLKKTISELTFNFMFFSFLMITVLA